MRHISLLVSAAILAAPAAPIMARMSDRTGSATGEHSGPSSDQIRACIATTNTGPPGAAPTVTSARAAIHQASIALLAAAGSDDEVRQLQTDRAAAETILQPTDYERRQKELESQRTTRALFSGHLNIAILQAQRNRRIADARADTPARRNARETIARIDARLDEIQRGRDNIGPVLSAYDDARRSYDATIGEAFGDVGTDEPSLARFLILEQDAKSLGLCPRKPGPPDRTTASLLASKAAALAPALSSTIVRDEAGAGSADRLASTIALYRQSAMLSAPGTQTATLIGGMDIKLAEMRARENRIASVQRAQAAASAAAAARARMLSMAASGPDADAISAALIAAYFRAYPDLSRSTGLVSLSEGSVDTNMFIGAVHERLHAIDKRPNCTKIRAGTFRCSYTAQFEKSADYLGMSINGGSKTINRTDIFEVSDGVWRSSSVDHMAADLFTASRPAQSTASSSPSQPCVIRGGAALDWSTGGGMPGGIRWDPTIERPC